nr:spindle pole body component 110-like [Megalopta genalis]
MNFLSPKEVVLEGKQHIAKGTGSSPLVRLGEENQKIHDADQRARETKQTKEQQQQQQQQQRKQKEKTKENDDDDDEEEGSLRHASGAPWSVLAISVTSDPGETGGGKRRHQNAIGNLYPEVLATKGAPKDPENRKGATVNIEGARLIAGQKIDVETKTTSTQTSGTTIKPKAVQIAEETLNINRLSPRYIYLKQKKSSTVWNVDEDPAPQWLIAEALSAMNRNAEHSERRTKGETSSSKETEYELIISQLEQKLSRTKVDLEVALQKKTMAKEKYKKNLEHAKAEARRENEILQERIVRICTSVLENFGPRGMADKRGNSYQLKCSKRLRCLSSKLHKKLRMAVAKSNKLRRELAKTRATLKIKAEKCESMHKCFEKLQQEMDTSEINLNKLIAENLELRKRIEDTREWVQHNASKENHERTNAVHYRAMQWSRELINLKKKADEDFTTITQLRNKFMRSESANANKGFLLNSYKSQLADLNKEKNQLLSKITNLENEITAVKSNNSQLRAKISVLNTEKEKLLSRNEKSKADTEKSETENSKKIEDAVQQEVANMKAHYEETIKSMTTKLSAMKSQNMEYLKSIKDFLKKLYDSRGDYDKQRGPKEDEPSEKEAQETACNILNMTPEELSGFINGKAPNSINTWIFELNRILTKSNFSESLSKFLLKKATRKLKM